MDLKINFSISLKKNTVEHLIENDIESIDHFE